MTLQGPTSSPRVPPRFSVVIPTFQRCDLVIDSVQALKNQQFDQTFEVIVVVDGSQDGSAAALRELDVPFSLTVIEQPNLGAATARNRGASASRGDFLLFLDDDMEAHPRLLAEHERSHREGADVVFGHVPLSPKSPINFLSTRVGLWAEWRKQCLSHRNAVLTLHDFLTGQMSLLRELFFKMGGFDTSFTLGGTFGNEDVDFGYRLKSAGARLVFNPDAISWQNYVVQPHQYLKQWRQAGNADVAFARKHPEQSKLIFELNGSGQRSARLLWRPVMALSPITVPLILLIRWFGLLLAVLWPKNSAVGDLFFQVKAMEYWRGVWEAGDIPRVRVVRVLAYHAIRDLANAPIIERYAIPPELFRSHLDLLLRMGFRFISAAEFLAFLYDGCGLPRRPLLLTFDDGYEELNEVVLPLLKERNIHPVVFAVSGLIGKTNRWDETLGAPRLRLLDTEGLHKLAQNGVEIGAHSRTHQPLTRLSMEQLATEVGGSADDLQACGLLRPRMFAYPEGDFDQRVVEAVKRADLQAAFTVLKDVTVPGEDPFQIPRIEIYREDGKWRFLWKVMMTGCFKIVFTRFGSRGKESRLKMSPRTT